MCFLLFDDMVANPQRVCKSVFKFLGVDDSFVLQEKLHIGKGYQKKKDPQKIPYPEMSEKLYLMMQKSYIDSYGEFSDLTGLEIDSWYGNKNTPAVQTAKD